MSEAIVAQKTPILVEVEEGKSYWWCACGRSQNQPYCDGSHATTDIVPMEYVAERSRKLYFCACKKTTRAPLCDGTHNKL